MGTLEVDKLDPQSGTALEIGTSGDTVTVPSGVTLTVAGALNVTGTTALADGTVNVAELDIDGATDIGEAIVDADLLVIDNGAGGTNRKTAASRLKTFILADNSLDSDMYVDGSIDNAHLADDAVDSDEIAAGAIDLAHMSSESVDEDNLHISNAGSNGQALTKQSGNAGGLTWASAGASVLNDLTDVNMDTGHNIDGLIIQTNTNGSAPGTGTLADAYGNIGIGKDVYAALTSADYTIGIGYEALDAHTTGSYALAIGAFALSSSTSADSLAIGGSALNACDTEQDNLAIGHHAMKLANSGAEDNTVVGNFGGDAITSGDSNTIMGHHSGGAITSGSNNTIIGAGSGATLTTGGPVTLIGKNNDVHGSGCTDLIALGYNLTPSANNQFRFGYGGTDNVYNQYASNASWTRSSDERIKKEIKTNEDCGLDFINDLRTVTFKRRAPSELPKDFEDYDSDVHEPKHKDKLYGMIAQEVKATLDKHNITDFGGWTADEVTGMQKLSQEMFVYPLIKAVQELSAEVKELKAKLEDK